jgi:hypothetical protein
VQESAQKISVELGPPAVIDIPHAANLQVFPGKVQHEHAEQ